MWHAVHAYCDELSGAEKRKKFVLLTAFTRIQEIRPFVDRLIAGAVLIVQSFCGYSIMTSRFAADQVFCISYHEW
jgi:hypothetical protein